MNSDQVRQTYLDFFASKGHAIVSSSPLVPGNDPTLLFTNAGMVQFKDVFLGMDKRDYSRATSSQKCMRISGKHNDLENVGPSQRHHTFFEMLGNFSFGDYFKEDAIAYAWELLTEHYKLPIDRLAVTIFEKDDESYDIWVNQVGLDPKRITRLGPKDNFWQMAEVGPCGPNSEIHWDKYPERGVDDIIPSLQADDNRFLEIWNLVFMQFNRTQADPDHTGDYDDPLPAPGVDTGMGLERMVSVMQGVPSNYDTDLFMDIMDATQDILKHQDAFREENYVAYRVIADHTRAVTFLIADGVTPGSDGRSYIARMLIRRAWRFAHKMGVEQPFLSGVAGAVIDKMSAIYPETRRNEDMIKATIENEEQAFIRTMDQAVGVFEGIVSDMENEKRDQMAGEEAFLLRATYGLPFEITRDLLQERGLELDEVGYDAAMEEHRRISGDIADDFEDVSVYQDLLANLRRAGTLPEDGVAYDPYDYSRFNQETTVLAIVKDGAKVDSLEQDE
ncbi:MAG: alanine--tRNA ligase, partial [Chloroflexi bacterium]|nr:alanine--tRNA ligase [Chloroflexota bacterium]